MNICRKARLLAALAAVCAGTLFAQQKPAQTPPTPAPSASPAAASGTSPNDASYKIGPTDMLSIDVWKDPNISRIVPVRSDGKISLPLVNDVQAAGLTPMGLAANLTEGLAKFISNPQVTVIVTQMNSQRIYIMGEVTRPGAFPLLPGMTVLQGLSSAGGFTQFANTKKIYVLRKENGKDSKLRVNYKDILEGDHPDENIVLQPGDTIVVP